MPTKKRRSFSNATKGLGVEARFQISFVKWLKLQYPHVLSHHSHNEGASSRADGAIAKALGQCRGFPDLIILEPRSDYSGLALEFKSTFSGGRVGKVSPHQKEILAKLEQRKWFCKVVYTLEEAIYTTKTYLNGR